MDGINSWTGLGLVDVLRMVEDRDQWHKVVVHSVLNCWIDETKDKTTQNSVPRHMLHASKWRTLVLQSA